MGSLEMEQVSNWKNQGTVVQIFHINKYLQARLCNTQPPQFQTAYAERTLTVGHLCVFALPFPLLRCPPSSHLSEPSQLSVPQFMLFPLSISGFSPSPLGFHHLLSSQSAPIRMSKPWQQQQTRLCISEAYQIKVLFSVHSKFTDDCQLSKALGSVSGILALPFLRLHYLRT